MAPYSNPLMPNLDQLEKMNQDLTRMMPKEMASAVNLLAHPVAGAAAMSALGFGLANHAFGVWLGALSGAAEASQRIFHPIIDDFEQRTQGFSETAPATKARAATRTLIAEAQTFAQDVTDIAARTVDAEPEKTDAVAEGATIGLMPEDFRQPKAVARPAKPSDLKAITGVGPKLEKVLNGLGIWTFAQIAAWAPEEIAWVEDYLSLTGRIGRDEWTRQAAALTLAAKAKK
ncbi:MULTISPECIES: NADH-ubiquinone dehydrogenase subunit [unclassified Mesorhizobium]|uniref:NADH-ubiquinone dehydrogenase subunit n=1 Tax=unclassified Mesorhizobium TaxID=325217 RepID=UPI0003CEB029|nr:MULTISPECIES: NADH-ubiquinone dehydrogenase subunit [unclassified Mesorhizobium]ESY57694.1 NADH-ubiquinone dehydrogenase subunit [Mesorhizobium sp. LNJC374B00]ESY60393.1 NADH-ubiquinone dehydrogenase subunit [Mesorhizobium sp. LNJC372A00]WJI78357.1 NADH-ubiquinone dehydrogenase [Mesorhizobium sp. C374B]WJI84893.1 NADH-ubiquinone dehydrogenase [Mesorhizobium sp. C372A]